MHNFNNQNYTQPKMGNLTPTQECTVTEVNAALHEQVGRSAELLSPVEWTW